MLRDAAFPGWCALCRRAGVTAVAVGAVLVIGPATSARPAEPVPAAVRLSAAPAGGGLSWPGWTLPDRIEQRRELVVLQQREQARRAAPAAPATPVSVPAVAPAVATTAAPPPAATPPTLGSGTTLAAPQAVSVAIGFALSQLGKPYVWGATGPDSYDCSGLVQTSYAAAGVALPRTSRQQARVGTPVRLADLLPGDLVFWAYDPGDLSTVHHVAMYLGDGKVVQSPQSGETVKVSTLWLSGYAGAVRVAGGPADTPLPTTPVAVPGPDLTPVGDEGVPDGPPVPVRPLPPTRPAAPPAPNPGPTAPGTTAPGTTAPGTTAPGTTAPGTTAPGTTAPGTTAPGTSTPPTPDTVSPGTSEPAPASPGTTAPGTTAPGTTPPPATTPAPTTPAPAPTTPAPTTPAPTTPAATSAAATTPPPTTPPPAPTTPAPTTPPPTTPPPTPASTTPEGATPAATPTATP